MRVSDTVHLPASEVARFVNPSTFNFLPFARRKMIATQILHEQGDPRAWQLEADSQVLTRFVIDTQLETI